MKRNLLLLILLFSSIILFEQCEKSKNIGYIKFSDEIRNIIPYKANETIIFSDSTGDTVMYHFKYAAGSSFNLYYEDEGTKGFDPEESDYYMVEHYEIDSDDGKLWIRIDFSPGLKAMEPIFLRIRFLLKNHPELYVGAGTCGIRSGQLYEVINYSKLSEYDSLMIINKKFYKVYRLDFYIPVTPDSSEILNTTFYSVDKGLVGFRTNKGRRWCLQ
jgi:hypothetical protein